MNANINISGYSRNHYFYTYNVEVLMTSYGLPYTGSKNRLAEKIVAHFPEADTLVDVFFGGGAITHCAMVHGKFKNYIANDIRTTPQFFKECIEGKHSNDLRWISSDDFAKSSRDDWFVRLIWSFSNNCNVYLYGKNIEAYKKAFHYAICFNDFSLLEELYGDFVCNKVKEHLQGIPVESWNDRRLAAMRAVKELIAMHPNELTRKDFSCSTDTGGNLQQHLERVYRIESLMCSTRITNLEHLNRATYLNVRTHDLHCYNLDYHLLADVIPDNSVVYLDPPYKGTFDYSENISGGCMVNTGCFNTEEFLDWAYEIGRKHPTFISEHNIDDDRFTLVDEWGRFSAASGSGKRRHVSEKLYTVKR